MLSHATATLLRFVAILSVLISLPPTLWVKGRENDPLRNVDWWPHEYHSGVLVVCLATVLGITIYFVLAWRLRKWWVFSLAGICNAAIPAVFYAIATPSQDIADVPLSDMFFSAFFTGLLGGTVVYFLLKRHVRADGPNNSLERSRER